jgi:hypothetical protein
VGVIGERVGKRVEKEERKSGWRVEERGIGLRSKILRVQSVKDKSSTGFLNS